MKTAEKIIETVSAVKPSEKPSLEALKLHLIQSRPDAVRLDEAASHLSSELVAYLLRALENADARFASDIETLLTHGGDAIVPDLVAALNHSNPTVRGTAAMALIRIGSASVQPLKQFYTRHLKPSKIEWIVAFILQELGSTLPKSDSGILTA
ncbi:MAG: hypothetical protein K2X01_10070 [Cyanobacteria bacterium]|nr:hypothetical protein [Cyanobacteriota bacterium]